MSEESQEPLNKTYDALKQLRDKLKLKLHLGGMDVRDEWEKLDAEWNSWTDQVGRELNATAEELDAKIHEAGGEDLRKIEIKTKLAVGKLKKDLQAVAKKLAEG